MKTFLSLVKIEIQMIFSKQWITKKNSKKATFGLLAILVPAIAMLYMSGVYSYLISTLLTDDLMYILIMFGVMLTSLILFMMTFYNASGHLFGFKDYDLLMSLPLKTSYVMASKLVAFLLINYVFTFFVLIPPLAIYAYRINPAISFYLISVIVFIFLPILPLVGAGLVSFLTSYFSSKTRYRTLIATLISFVLLLLLMVVSFNIESYFQYLVSQGTELLLTIKKIYPIGYWATTSLLTYNIVDLLLFVVISFGTLLLFVLIFNRSFYTINAKLQKTKKSVNKKKVEYEANSTIKALFIKEVRRYFATPIYIFNTAFGPVMIFAGAIVTLFMGYDKIAQLAQLPQIGDMLMPMLLGLVAFTAIMTSTTSPSISLEGKNLWILKSNPISHREVFISKVLLNLLIIIPLMIINILIFVYSFNLNILQLIMLLLALVIISVFTSTSGLIVNLYFPRFDWNSEVVVVKQSMSVVVAMGLNALLAFLIGGVYYETSSYITFNQFYLIAMVIVVVLTLGMVYFLDHKGKDLFNNL